jgi:hypothetical protein
MLPLLNQFFYFFITVGLLLIIENYINSLNFICEIKINKEKITFWMNSIENGRKIDTKKLKSK